MAKGINLKENRPTDSDLDVIKKENIPQKEKEVKFPDVRGNGKFQSVKFENGYVIYNPNGQRVSEVISLDIANDIVNRQNSAGGYK
jgi:hypothetical protein